MKCLFYLFIYFIYLFIFFFFLNVSILLLSILFFFPQDPALHSKWLQWSEEWSIEMFESLLPQQ